MENLNVGMVPTMAPTMIPNTNHLDIPGNPSTATSSQIALNDRSNGTPLRVLSETDWEFWICNHKECCFERTSVGDRRIPLGI